MDEYYSWMLDPEDNMIILIRYLDKILFKISLYEVIESSSRKKILEHIEECDRTPWLYKWQEEIADAVADRLKGKR